MDLIAALRELAVLATNRPSPKDLARSLGVHILQEFDVQFVSLHTLDTQGQWTCIASFGEIDQRWCHLMDPTHGSVDLLRRSRPKTYRVERVQEFGDLDAIQPASDHAIVLPLILQGLLVGSSVIGTGVHPRANRYRDFWETVAVCLAALLAPASAHAIAPSPEAHLSPRHRQILALVAEGLTNQQIGRRLGFSESTIGHDLVAAYERLGVRNREDAVRAITRRPRMRTGALA